MPLLLIASIITVSASVTSAGIINQPENNKRFALITSSIRDEGTSYHYLPPEKPAIINQDLFEKGEEFGSIDTLNLVSYVLKFRFENILV